MYVYFKKIKKKKKKKKKKKYLFIFTNNFPYQIQLESVLN